MIRTLQAQSKWVLYNLISEGGCISAHKKPRSTAKLLLSICLVKNSKINC